MKLTAAEGPRLFARADPGRAGVLICGADAMRVALKRQEIIAAIIGPEGEADMRLDRIAASDLRKGGAALTDALKAQGFFPGPRAVFLEDATDGLAPVIGAALAERQPGDATLVVTGGALTAKSPLRKLFEAHPHAYAMVLYDDPPTREEVEQQLEKAGLRQLDRAVLDDLTALGRALDPGDFRQTLEKIALYKSGDPAPLTAEDIAACAPATAEAEVDDVIHVAADGRVADIGPLMQRLAGQGTLPVTLCIALTRHFRALHAVAAEPGGAAAGLSRLRPPLFGPRRDAVLRQVQALGLARIETALTLLIDTDLALRSSSRAPAMALMERALIRIAMLTRR